MDTKCCEVSPGGQQGWGGPMVRGVWGRVVVHTHYRAFHVGELDLHVLLWGTMLVLGFAPVLHPSWINTWLCGNNAQVISSIHESRPSLKRREVLFCTLAHGGTVRASCRLEDGPSSLSLWAHVAFMLCSFFVPVLWCIFGGGLKCNMKGNKLCCAYIMDFEKLCDRYIKISTKWW